MFRIDVQDTGVGISAEDLGRLLVEFQQLDASAAKTHQGTGLGLALTSDSSRNLQRCGGGGKAAGDLRRLLTATSIAPERTYGV